MSRPKLKRPRKIRQSNAEFIAELRALGCHVVVVEAASPVSAPAQGGKR